MNKVIILIEDEVYKLKEELLHIQSLLSVATVRGLNNAPNNNDTEICVLHIQWEDECNERCNPNQDSFARIKDILEERRQKMAACDRITIPNIDYNYRDVILKRDNYRQKYEDCAFVVNEQIEKICKDKKFAIMLDVILNKNDDTKIILENSDSVVLSQKIYERYKKQCVAYTRYGTTEARLRDEWKKKAGYTKRLFSREALVGDAILKPLKNEIYSMLEIGEEKQ